MDVDLSVIIVNWNTRDPLRRCLESVASELVLHPCVSIETILVDNASTDGSATMVRECFPWVRLIESPENLGFAAGNNLALRQAVGQQFLLLNPDTVVPAGSISKLRQVLVGNPTVGIVGAQLLNADGSLQTSCGFFPSLLSELPLVKRYLRPVRAVVLVDTPDGKVAAHSVDWVSGACLMVRRLLVEAIGPLDEAFWLYTEEADWCYRARAAGWNVLLVPQVQIYHLARAASGQRFVFTMLHFYQSRIRFACKHYGRAHALTLKKMFQLKAMVWSRYPSASPLRSAYSDLSDDKIMAAYEVLLDALALPLPRFLVTDWSKSS